MPSLQPEPPVPLSCSTHALLGHMNLRAPILGCLAGWLVHRGFFVVAIKKYKGRGGAASQGNAPGGETDTVHL